MLNPVSYLGLVANALTAGLIRHPLANTAEERLLRIAIASARGHPRAGNADEPAAGSPVRGRFRLSPRTRVVLLVESATFYGAVATSDPS